MNKKDFINELKKNLKHLSKIEIDEILFDYNEHFDAAKENGLNDKQIVKKLGNPKTIAKHMHASELIQIAQTDNSLKSFIRAFFASLGLGFFNLIFILGPFGFLIGALLFALFWIVMGIIAPTVIFFGVVFGTIKLGISLLSGIILGLGVTLGAIFLIIIWGHLVKCISKYVLKYLKFNIKLITGKNNKWNTQ